MVVGRPISDICRELAESAQTSELDLLAQMLRMAALQADLDQARFEDNSIRDRLVGTWDWDIVHDRVYADSRFSDLFGLDARAAVRGLPLASWLDAIHPDDVGAVAASIDRAINAGSLFSQEYRIIAHGEVRWVYARGKCTTDASGKTVRFPGAIVDITHEKVDERHLSIAPN